MATQISNNPNGIAAKQAQGQGNFLTSKSRSDEIWNNVYEGVVNAGVSMSNRSDFDSRFGYSSKPADERAVLDAYWKQAQDLMKSGKSAFQAATALKKTPYSGATSVSWTPITSSTGGNNITPDYSGSMMNTSGSTDVPSSTHATTPSESAQISAMIKSGRETNKTEQQIMTEIAGKFWYGTPQYESWLTWGGWQNSLKGWVPAGYSSTNPDGTISASAPNAPQIDYGNGPVNARGGQVLDSRVNLGDESQRQANFESGFQAYIDAQTAVYGIETTRQNRKFGEQRQDAGTAIARNREDYAKFTGREITDTARTLAKNDTSFAKSLSSATQAYGKRGIINAGIQKSSLWEAVSEFGWDQNYLKTLSQRRLSDAGTANSRAETDYTTNMGRLDTTVSEYAGDRAAGLAAQTATLQQQGDTLYNAAQVQNAQLAQQQADQAALDRYYGRTPQNRPITMRMGWKYTT